MPQPPAPLVKCITSIFKEYPVTPCETWETADYSNSANHNRAPLSPLTSSRPTMENVPARRIPFTPLSQHPMTPKPFVSNNFRINCGSPRRLQQTCASPHRSIPISTSPNRSPPIIILSPDGSPPTIILSPDRSSSLNPIIRSPKRSPPIILNHFPRVCVSPLPISTVYVSPQRSPRKTLLGSPRSPHKNGSPQWVIADSRSSSPELFHLCGECEAEFPSIQELQLHKCRNTRVKFVQPLRPSPIPDPEIRQVPQFIPEPSKPRRQAPATPAARKDSFLRSLGLEGIRRQRPRTQEEKPSPRMPPAMSSLRGMHYFRDVPFSHLPEEMRLRNNTFFPASRAEAANRESIENNWRKVDKMCPAFPACHRRYVRYAGWDVSFTKPRPPPSVRLGAQALALKRTLKQPRLVVRRLTLREIRLAAAGVNTQALMREGPVRTTTRRFERSRVKRRPVPRSMARQRAQPILESFTQVDRLELPPNGDWDFFSALQPTVLMQRLSEAEIRAWTHPKHSKAPERSSPRQSTLEQTALSLAALSLEPQPEVSHKSPLDSLPGQFCFTQ